MDLRKISKATRHVTVEIGGETLHVEYYTNSIKLRELLHLPDASNTAALIEVNMGVLARQIAKWDLMDGTKAVPITYESLIELPQEFVAKVQKAIQKDGMPGEGTGSN